MGHVKCGICNRRYRSIFSGSNQGIACAAEVTGGKLLGHYGSEVADMDAFSFSRMPPPEGTIICDACILEAMSKGEIVKIEPTKHMLSDTENTIMSGLLDARTNGK